MAHLDHHRPQLRYLDNLRREFQNAGASAVTPASSSTEWPPFLRPVAAKPKSLSALFDWIEKVSEWFDDESIPFALSEPPPEVSRAAKAFLDTKVHDPYDPSFTGRDWFRKIASDETPLAKALVALLTLGIQQK
jgi:hypothetical protein